MKYEYREVKCPWCEHIFMWNKNGRENHILCLYKLKETGQYIEEAKCPKCNKKILVLDDVLEGIDIDDNRIEHIGIRGI